MAGEDSADVLSVGTDNDERPYALPRLNGAGGPESFHAQQAIVQNHDREPVQAFNPLPSPRIRHAGPHIEGD